MESHLANTLDDRLASRLRTMRGERSWSLDDLASKSGVSRATLSRLENGDVSPTAQVLGKLCVAYETTMSRLMTEVERDFLPVISKIAQETWVDPETGFQRRLVSPPAQDLTGEVLEAQIPPGQKLVYETPRRQGLDHHLVLLEGALTVTLGSEVHGLATGDCLRYRLIAGNTFETPPDEGARYLLFIV